MYLSTDLQHWYELEQNYYELNESFLFIGNSYTMNPNNTRILYYFSSYRGIT